MDDLNKKKILEAIDIYLSYINKNDVSGFKTFSNMINKSLDSTTDEAINLGVVMYDFSKKCEKDGKIDKSIISILENMKFFLKKDNLEKFKEYTQKIYEKSQVKESKPFLSNLFKKQETQNKTINTEKKESKFIEKSFSLLKKYQVIFVAIIILLILFFVFNNMNFNKKDKNETQSLININNEVNTQTFKNFNQIFCEQTILINNQTLNDRFDNNTCSKYTYLYCLNGEIISNCEKCDCKKQNDSNYKIISTNTQNQINTDKNDKESLGGGAPAGIGGPGWVAGNPTNSNPTSHQINQTQNNLSQPDINQSLNETIDNNITQSQEDQNITINETNQNNNPPQTNYSQECYMDGVDSNSLTIFSNSICHDSTGDYSNLCASPINQEASTNFIKTYICVDNKCSPKYYSCKVMGQNIFQNQDYMCITDICTT